MKMTNSEKRRKAKEIREDIALTQSLFLEATSTRRGFINLGFFNKVKEMETEQGKHLAKLGKLYKQLEEIKN